MTSPKVLEITLLWLLVMLLLTALSFMQMCDMLVCTARQTCEFGDATYLYAAHDK